MGPIAFVVHVAAVVVAVTGARKVVAPGPVTKALDASGLPATAQIGRLVGAGELGAGVWVVAGGGRASAAALALVYGGFIAFIVANRLRGLDVPCGCIGESTTPPGTMHLVVNVVAVVAAVAAVVTPVGTAAEWLDNGWSGAVALAAVVVAAGAVIAALDQR